MTSRSSKVRRKKSAHPPRSAPTGRGFPVLLGFLAVFTAGLILFAVGVLAGLISF